MLRVDVIGTADAEAVAAQLRDLDSRNLLQVRVRSAPAPTADAGAVVVAAPSAVAVPGAAEGGIAADVVLRHGEPLLTQVSRLWSERLSEFGWGLAGRPNVPSPAVLKPHDDTWAVTASRYLGRLEAALGRPPGSSFEHIGSTAVPGLSAKPILDLQIRLTRLRHDRLFDTALHRVGFRPAVGSRLDSPGVYRDIPRGSEHVPDRVWNKRLFYRPDPAQLSILHVRMTASPWGRYTILFRDWLRHNPVERNRYEQAKRELARVHAGDADYDDYTRGKTAYFDRVQAQVELAGTSTR